MIPRLERDAPRRLQVRLRLCRRRRVCPPACVRALECVCALDMGSHPAIHLFILLSYDMLCYIIADMV
jgi:hypothetical protein